MTTLNFITLLRTLRKNVIIDSKRIFENVFARNCLNLNCIYSLFWYYYVYTIKIFIKVFEYKAKNNVKLLKNDNCNSHKFVLNFVFKKRRLE